MTFHSLDFAAFFALVVGAYWALPARGRTWLLLAASYLFYGWVHPWFVTLLLATTLTAYGAARGMQARPAWRTPLLWLALAVGLGLLGWFKYFDFFVGSAAAIAAWAGWPAAQPVLGVALPVGISFYTFQALGYVLDVYWHRTPARASVVDVAAFVAFFPSLLAGPIMRAGTLMPQLESPRRFAPAAARDAALLLLWGFFKKLVIADRVGVIADKVFALRSPEFYVLWAGVFAFGIQIYADFSAYADIARGVAKWLGIDLIENFNHPYLAQNPSDFWRRWNISLSTWFRDYLFLPVAYAMSDRLPAERQGLLGAATCAYIGGMMVTMLTAGLWHGASWNYVIWGGYHGVLLALARVVTGGRRRRPRRWLMPMKIAGMFLLVNIGWLLFRETDLAQLARDLTLSPFHASALGRRAGAYLFFLAAIYSVPLWVQSLWVELGGPNLVSAMLRAETRPNPRSVAAQAMIAGLLAAGILVLHSTASPDFIYFRF